jgi:hypothetical protein
MNKWLIGGGVLIVGVAGYLVLRSRPQSAPEPVDSADVQMPAMMYMPSGGGNIMPTGTGNALSPAMLSDPKTTGASSLSSLIAATVGADIKARDVAALSTVTLTAGQTASITHSDAGSSFTVQNAPVDPNAYNPKYTSAQIKDFVGNQAAAGVPINAASVTAWAKQYNVPTTQIAAAFGMSESGAQAWLAANPGA